MSRDLEGVITSCMTGFNEKQSVRVGIGVIAARISLVQGIRVGLQRFEVLLQPVVRAWAHIRESVFEVETMKEKKAAFKIGWSEIKEHDRREMKKKKATLESSVVHRYSFSKHF